MRVDLRGKVIAITGASSGIGRATAIACARAGMSVVVHARREDRLIEVVKQIESEGGRAAWCSGDVARTEDNRRLVDFAVSRFGSLYSVFANAGYGLERPVLGYTDEELLAIFQTNFQGTLDLMRLAGRMLLERPRVDDQPRGHVLVCSSCVSKIGLPQYAAYSASKALQDHFARAMRIELADQGVAVSSVHPIGTRTEFFDVAKDLSGGKRVSIQTPERFKQPAETVADAVVRCLRRPRGEVWTSTPMRALLALGTLFPGFADYLLLRRHRSVSRGA